VEVLSSRILLRPADLGRSRRFYRDVLGLAICREFGDPADPAVVSFSARACWKCRDVRADHPLRRDPRSLSSATLSTAP
jgi:hypothetical protein